MARAQTASKVWKQLLCDPQGNLHGNGQLALSDLAKYCRAHDAPTRHDSNGKVDVEATFEAIGMHKLYRRICTLLAIDDARATKLAMLYWPQQQDEDDDL
jgi:hypothetical protein